MTEATAPPLVGPGSEDLPRENSHRNNFDFLRLCFASLVILSHSPELIDGNRRRELLTRLFHTLSFGEVGVAGFFLLSGYLISQSWDRNPKPIAFLRNRVLRIYPGFIVASLFTAFVFGPFGADRVQYFAHFDFVAFAKSALALRLPAIPPTKIENGSMWTIRSEFVCYLMLLALGLCGLVNRKFCAPLIFLVVALLFIKKRVLFAPYNFYGFFFAGASFYHLRDRVRFTLKGSIVALVVLLSAMLVNPVVAWLGICTAGAYLLFGFAFRSVPALQRVAQHGDVSYGTYLYAWPIECLIITIWPKISPWLVFLLVLPLSMGSGWLSWHGVEKHFLRLKKRSTKPILGTA
jgi:peptidoglycan/LPS O-acetylase OafA/YrhL